MFVPELICMYTDQKYSVSEFTKFPFYAVLLGIFNYRK